MLLYPEENAAKNLEISGPNVVFGKMYESSIRIKGDKRLNIIE
jgi:hypothetical protein